MEPADKPVFAPGGVATGIGSLPHTDPREALELILECLPHLPHWPQLPRRGRREHFVHQFLQPLVACGMLRVVGERWLFDTTRDETAACLTDFYTVCLPAEAGDADCLGRFLPPPESAAGFHAFLEWARGSAGVDATYVKGQIAGPLTVALELKDQQGRPAYYVPDLRDIVVRTLAMNARSQAAALRQPGVTPIIFVDDPAISACGSRLHLALDRRMIREDLDLLVEAISSEGALAGLHACQAIDWSIVLESEIQVLSLDAFRYGRSLIPYAEGLRRFVARGGVVAWGIVPTVDDPFEVSAADLRRQLERLWSELFAGKTDRETIVRQSLITPACGTGLLSVEQAHRIYRLTGEVSRSLRSN